MTNSNGGNRLSQLESLVSSLAQSSNQIQSQQAQINQQLNERLSEFILVSNENFQATETQIAQLAASQKVTNEALRSIGASVSRLSDVVIPQMAARIDENNQLIREIQTEIKGLQLDNRRIIERVFGEQNGEQ